MIRKLFFVDIETRALTSQGSALVPSQAQIIEIGAAACDIDHRGYAVVRDIYHALITPSGPLCEYSTEKFKNVDWSKAWSTYDALSNFVRFYRMVEGAWIGQNPYFDKSHLIPAIAKYGLPWPDHTGYWPGTDQRVDYHMLDLFSMTHDLVQEGILEGGSLRYSRKWAGCPGEQGHRALEDVSDSIAVYNALAAYRRGREYVYENPMQLPLKSDLCTK